MRDELVEELKNIRNSYLPMPVPKLDDDEVDAVLLGLQLVCQSPDDDLAAAAESAVAKFEALLPPIGGKSAAPNQLSVAPGGSAVLTHAATAEAAMAVEQKLLLQYVDRKGSPSKRIVWPVFIDESEGFAAWCETRRDFRNFRFDRIVSLKQLPDRIPTRLRVLRASWRSQAEDDGY